MALTRLPGFTVDSTSSFTFANATVTANVAAGNIKTDNLLYANGSPWTFAGAYANSNVSSYLPTYSGLVAGTLSTQAQPNITSIGSLTSLTSGLITATSGGVKLGNIQDPSGTNTISLASGNVTMLNSLNVGTSGTGNVTASYFIGNGSQLTGLPATYANSNVASYLPTYTGNITGNIITLTGNVTAINANLGNLVTANYFSGSGNLLSNIAGGNVTGQVASALIAGTVTATSQPNISSVGTLTSLTVTNTITGGNLSTNGTLSAGDATITGNLTVNGTTVTANVTTMNVKDPIIEMGGNTSGALTSNDGKDRGSVLHYFTTETVDAFMGWDNSNAEFAFGSNVSVSSEVVTFNSLGNVRASYYLGNGSQLTGQIGNALVAGTVYTNAQPNITSVGTLTTLTASGNVTASYFIGNGSQLTGLPATYANSNVASYLPTYTGDISPANLVVTNSANLGAVGNVIITGGTANYVLKTDGAGNLSWTAQTGGSGSSTSTTIAVDNFTGNGVADTYTLSVIPTSVNSVFVNYNGAFVGRGSYSLDGANLTFGSIPANGASIEVTTIEGLTIGSGAFTTRTATGDGTNTTYTVTSGATVSSVLVTLDGVLQTPTTDYTISGTTLTFTTAPYNGAAIQIRELAVASSSGGTGGASLSKSYGVNMFLGF